MICPKCSLKCKRLVHHHEKYLEIHGVDKIVMMCDSCHRSLHKSLRRKGKCKIPALNLERISKDAYERHHKEDYLIMRNKYLHKNVQWLNFSIKLDDRVKLRHKIRINELTGEVTNTFELVYKRTEKTRRF